MKVKDRRSAKPAHRLEYLFHPRSIAIVGVSSDPKAIAGGRIFLDSLVKFGYKGKLYPVNRTGGELFGLKVYNDFKDIPDTIDHVIAAIPARYTIPLIYDCAGKGVRSIQVFSGGFSETSDTQGVKLESELTRAAHETGIRIIGPNCMGIYYPKMRMTFQPEFPRRSGPVGLISQSGLNTALTVQEGAARGVFFSKAISYGNACDLDESDFLEYLAQDPDTKIIAGYIEGVDDGRRLMDTLKQVVKVKPVIFFKAGNTEYGIGAAASHTGTLAGSSRTWESVLKQLGVIQVSSVEELIDVIIPFLYLDPPAGKNIALIGMGGGATVQGTDECARAGLKLPPLPAEVRMELEKVYGSEVGGSFRNPIDMYWGRKTPIRETFKAVYESRFCDLLMVQIVLHTTGGRWLNVLRTYVEAMAELGKEINRHTVITLRILGGAGFWSFASKAHRSLVKAGFPVYPSVPRAASAVVKFIDYHRRREALAKEEE